MIEIKNFGWTFTQLLLAFVVVLILYVLTLIVLSIDAIVSIPTYKVKPREESVVVLDATKTSSADLAKLKFNTVFPFTKGNYVKIPKSVNGTSGTQFTYQFWMKINDITSTNYKDLVLLLKGDNKKYKVGYYDASTYKLLPDKIDHKPRYMIKCPLIRFKDNYKTMVVELNTNNHPDVHIDIDMTKGDDDNKRKNLLTLLPLDWFLFTFVFEENYSIQEGTENGIKFTFYVNDIPFQSNSGSTDDILRNNFLKQNDGDLHILPNFEDKTAILNMKNIKYFNYAKIDAEVRSDFEKGARSLDESERSQSMFSSM